VPVSRLTSKYQATIPRNVRERLGLHAGDRIEFISTGTGIEVRKATDQADDDARADDAAFAPEWLSDSDETAWHDL
jgi:antitoxin PrlF